MSGIILNITNVSVAKMASETASHMYNVALNMCSLKHTSQ